MTKNDDVKVLLLEEYKEGFKEISNMVDQFEQLSLETQTIFIKERINFLQEQLQELQVKKNDFTTEMRKIVAQLNSRFKAYSDNEKILTGQIDESKSFLELVNSRVQAVQDTKGAEIADAKR